MIERKNSIYILQTNYEDKKNDPILATVVNGFQVVKAFEKIEDADKAKDLLHKEILLDIAKHASHKYKSAFNQYNFINDIINRIDISIGIVELEKENEEDKELKYRASGRTTRLVDYYIQELFKNGKIENITDHYDDVNAHLRLVDLIEKRLYIEHNRIKYKRKNRNIILL